MDDAIPGRASLSHEPDRVPVVIILTSAGALLGAVGATLLAVWTLLPTTHPEAIAPAAIPHTPAARDWGDAGRDQLSRLRAREDANLGTYQWLDPEHTAARIPIAPLWSFWFNSEMALEKKGSHELLRLDSRYRR